MQRSVRRVAMLALAMLLAGPALCQQGGRGYLGVYLTDLSDGTRRALGLEEDQGVLIERVMPESAAEKADLRPGDVLLKLGGREVDSSASLGRELERSGAGTTVEMEILRKGKHQTLETVLGSRSDRAVTLWAPQSGELAAVTVPELPELVTVPEIASGTLAPLITARGLVSLQGRSANLGLRTTELTGQLAEYFEVARGLLVTWVVPDSPAGKAGLRAGDILVTLGGQPLGREEDLPFILGTSRGEEILVVEVMRKGKKESLSLKL